MKTQLNVIRAVIFMYYAINALLLPYLPLYFYLKGYGAKEIGLFMMAGPFAAMFAQPLWGYLSDRFRSLKSIIFILFAATIASSVGLFYSEGYGPALFYSTLLFFFYLPAAPLLDSLAVKSAAEYGGSYGSVRQFGSIGFFAIALSSAFLLPLVGGVANLQYAFWALWVPTLILLIFLRDKSVDGAALTLRSMKSILVNRQFLWFLAVSFFVAVPHRMHDALFGLYHQSLGATPGMVSASWALAAGSEVAAFIWAARNLHKFREWTLLGIAAALYAVRWTAYILIDDPWVLLFLNLTHALTFAFFWVVSVAYVVRLIPEHLRSTGQALYSSVFMGLGGLAGGFFGGWFQDRFGGPGMYTFALGASAFAALLFFLSSKREEP